MRGDKLEMGLVSVCVCVREREGERAAKRRHARTHLLPARYLLLLESLWLRRPALALSLGLCLRSLLRQLCQLRGERRLSALGLLLHTVGTSVGLAHEGQRRLDGGAGPEVPMWVRPCAAAVSAARRERRLWLPSALSTRHFRPVLLDLWR